MYTLPQDYKDQVNQLISKENFRTEQNSKL